MSISQSDIELICNYKESDKPSTTQGSIYYIDVLTSTDEWVINERKRIKRQETISEVLGEKMDKSESEWLPFNSDADIPVASPRVMSVSVTSRNFTDMNSLYNDILTYLNNITSSPMRTPQNPLDINISNGSKLTFENRSTTARRIITKLTFCSNLIMMTGRMGPTNVALVGTDIMEYLDDNEINGLKIIHTPLIKSNKVIVIKTIPDLGPGLNVLKHDDGGYYIKETPTYEKMIAWFELI